jgi:hypothetical protein
MISRLFVDATEEDEHHQPSMFRWYALVVGVCLSASGVAHADSPDTQAPLTAAKQAEFDEFVAMAKRAQLAGRYQEAATAYKAALDIQLHPVVAGRYGLVLMKLGQLDKAANELHEAHERGQGVSLQERRDVAAAYDQAKMLTTWVNVTISHVGATVTCDGEPWNREGISAFWRFAMPGEHTIRAKLDGFEDAVETFTAKPGEEITISLNLVPLAGPKLPELPAPVAATLPDTRVFPPLLPASNVADDPNYSPKEDPFYGEPKDTKPAKKKDGPRFSINGGVVTVFGVASWNPAVGGVVGVGIRPKEFLSLGLEGRAAWLTTGVADRQISAMTAGGIVSACGHLKWFFGCALGHLGTINVSFSNNSYTGKSYTEARLGVGGRIGAKIRVSESAFVLGSIEGLKLSKGVLVGVGDQIVADIPPVFFGGQISGGWEF